MLYFDTLKTTQKGYIYSILNMFMHILSLFDLDFVKPFLVQTDFSAVFVAIHPLAHYTTIIIVCPHVSFPNVIHIIDVKKVFYVSIILRKTRLLAVFYFLKVFYFLVAIF